MRENYEKRKREKSAILSQIKEPFEIVIEKLIFQPVQCDSISK